VPPVPVNDKVEHFGGFAILAMLVSISFSPPRSRGGVGGGAYKSVRSVAIALAICLAYAALDEWTQPFVGRTCDLRDWLADASGAIVGSLIALTLARRFSRFAAAPLER
jgi:VanZ family protein